MPLAYFEDAERYINDRWASVIWPQIQRLDFSVTLDFAAGHGRNSARLAQVARTLYAVDPSPEAVEFMRRRFAGFDSSRCLIQVVKDNGYDLAAIPSATITALYSFNSMVPSRSGWWRPTCPSSSASSERKS